MFGTLWIMMFLRSDSSVLYHKILFHFFLPKMFFAKSSTLRTTSFSLTISSTFWYWSLTWLITLWVSSTTFCGMESSSGWGVVVVVVVVVVAVVDVVVIKVVKSKVVLLKEILRKNIFIETFWNCQKSKKFKKSKKLSQQVFLALQIKNLPYVYVGAPTLYFISLGSL